MLRTIDLTRTNNTWLRLAAIAFFTILMALSAKITLEIGAVPFTMQPLVVLLAGMTLGARDGAAAMIAYVLLIAGGLPLDARSLGTAVFASPTWGYLIGFIAAAFVSGLLVEKGANRVWQRWLAGLVGVAVIYAFGLPVLMSVAQLGFDAAWAAGAAPFIAPDAVKALIAAGLVETLRAFLLRRDDR